MIERVDRFLKCRPGGEKIQEKCLELSFSRDDMGYLISEQ